MARLLEEAISDFYERRFFDGPRRREAALGHLSRRCAVMHRCSQAERGDLFPRMNGLVSFRRRLEH